MNIIDITPENLSSYGVCGYKNTKYAEVQKKLKWYADYYLKGLRMKVLIADNGSYQGMIEYIPGEFAHRPVEAEGYLFIHCLFVGFNKEYKGKGYAMLLINQCIEYAKNNGFKGVATVTRKGSFMADDKIYEKAGFKVTDKASPDFHLLALKFDDSYKNPQFADLQKNLQNYKKGLYILRSPQCPYTEKNVNQMIATAKEQFNTEVNLIELQDEIAAQNSPCAFGTFCIIYNGKILSHHPISNTRFVNIMNGVVG